MAITRSVNQIGNTPTLQLAYQKRNPATGIYYDSTEVTAATLTVYSAAGTSLVGPVAMSHVANLRGYVYDWTYGAALAGLATIYAYVTPTRAASVPAALAPDEIVPLDISEIAAAIAITSGDLSARLVP